MMLGAALIPIVMTLTDYAGNYLPIVAVYLLLARSTIITVFTVTDGEILNNTLAATGRLLIIFGVLFSLGWLL